MTKEIIKDCVFCENGRTCNIYPWTCDYDGYCSSNEECPIKKLKQENEDIINEYNKLQAEIIGDIEFKEIILTGITPLKVLQNLKQRNRELQAFYDVHESFKTDFDTNRKLLDKYRSALEEIREMTKKYDAKVGDTIIANPIQDCYDIYCKINEVLI